MDKRGENCVYQVENLAFSYPVTGGRFKREERELLLRDISFSLSGDQFTVLMGDNGTGKTTLGKLLLGILKPDAGRILLRGETLEDYSLAQVASKVGYLFQDPARQLFGSSVFEDLAFPLRLRGLGEEEIRERVQAVLEDLAIAHLEARPPYLLSQGEKQRAALAGILLNGAEYLVLDEPTTALDPKNRKRLGELLLRLKERGVGILMIGHDAAFIRTYADRCLRLEQGGLHDETL